MLSTKSSDFFFPLFFNFMFYQLLRVQHSCSIYMYLTFGSLQIVCVGGGIFLYLA